MCTNSSQPIATPTVHLLATCDEAGAAPNLDTRRAMEVLVRNLDELLTKARDALERMKAG
jgi:hypothetical protein